jgi:LytR cell envelope-related transcriptional attenuator
MKRGNRKSPLSAKRSAAIASEIVVVMFAVVLVYSLVDRFFLHPPVKANRVEENSPTKVEKQIQVSVRNECGAKNIAMNFTFYLRKRGFDVVETVNGSIPDRPVTTVVDAAGNYKNALRVAEALGVAKENVITKLDPRSYVDVEVLIGKDFQNLKPNESIE